MKYLPIILLSIVSLKDMVENPLKGKNVGMESLQCLRQRIISGIFIT
jgi:hypothetical protein